jgi:hypothetical protein
MIRFLLFFTIALSLASAVLAFLTKEKAAELNEKLSSSAQLAGALKNENAKIKEEKKTITAQVEELNNASQQQKKEIDKVQSAVVAKDGEVAKLKTDLQTSEAKSVDLEKKLAEKAAQPPAPVADPAMEQMVASLKADLEKVKQGASEEQAKAAEKIRGLESKMAQMVPKPAPPAGKSGEDKQLPTGEVVAFNEGWNFVVVNMGDKQGVTPESKLMVQRGGKVMARLEITEVQPKFVTAGLVYPPGTSAKDRVRPGDTVTFAPKVEPEPETERGNFNASALFPKPTTPTP